MKGNTYHTCSQPAETVKTWDIILDGEVIGSVHGQTEADARAIVAPFKLNFEIRPHQARD